MIENIVNGSEKSRFILIKEQNINTGLKLMKVLISGHVGRGLPVHVVCFDLPWVAFIQGFDEHTCKNLRKFDGFTDPLQWNEANDSCNSNISYSFLSNASAQDLEVESMLVVYSLCSLMLHETPNEICSSIYGFLRKADLKIEKLVVVITDDAENKPLISNLEQLTTTTIQVKNGKNSLLCQTRHNKSNKIIRADQELRITKNFGIESAREIEGNEKLPSVTISTPASEMNLTFNLNLKDDERAAREKVALPYVKPAKDAGKTTGIIYYEPEDVFLSDEDPDDDLDV